MTTTEALEKIKVFGMTNQMLCEDLQRIETQYKIELSHVGGPKDVAEASYYAQFDVAVRVEAGTMREHYEVFYCLEKSIRSIISETLEEAEKANWWDTARIPEIIKKDVQGRIQKEIDTGMTRRSPDAIDYTTFGELAMIITSNWDLFGSLFSSRKAVERIMANLNSLRGPIAHCSPLAEDEVLRLRLALRDWFRLME
jgi:HEPN superfamily Swt1-like protein